MVRLSTENMKMRWYVIHGEDDGLVVVMLAMGRMTEDAFVRLVMGMIIWSGLPYGSHVSRAGYEEEDWASVGRTSYGEDNGACLGRAGYREVYSWCYLSPGT